MEKRENKIKENAINISEAFANECTKGNPDEVYEKLKGKIKEAYIMGVKYADKHPLFPQRKFVRLIDNKIFDFAFMQFEKKSVQKEWIQRELGKDFAKGIFDNDLVKLETEYQSLEGTLHVTASMEVALRDGRTFQEDLGFGRIDDSILLKDVHDPRRIL